MTFLCIGVSHRQAPISVREQLALAANEIRERIDAARKRAGVREFLLLSTCNRVEVFAAAEGREAADDILSALGPIAVPHAVCRFEDEALLHLFRIAASLDSMVVGEAQILGQLKDAAAQAQENGSLGPELRRSVDGAVRAARRVRTETEIARGAVSLSSVAVQLARKLLGDLTDKTVLLLGAGEMAQLAARELRSEGAAEVLVANRSATRAEDLATQVGGVPVSLADLPVLLERADVAVCSTGAGHFVITHDLVARAAKARRYRPLFLVDLTLPRNVDPAANDLENVYVYDLDDLEHVAAQNRDLRAAHVEKAEAIVDEELKAFLAQARERQSVAVVARLRAHAEAVARAEVERTLAQLPGLDDRQQKSVRAMAGAIVNKLLHRPTARLRGEGGDGPLGAAAAALFGLDAQPGPQPVPTPLPNPQPDPAPIPEPDPEPARSGQVLELGKR